MATLMQPSRKSPRRPFAEWLGVVVSALVISACGGDMDSPPSPPVTDPPHALCPPIDPLVGPFAMKGACCYRTSNRAKLEQSATGTAELEFRIMASQVTTQTRTIGASAFLDFVQRGYDLNRSVSLIRIREFPKEPPGEVVIETGAGRFNADGTYSFLKDAAPITDTNSDVTRWDSVIARAYYDPSAPEGQRFVPVEDDLATRLVLTPEWQTSGDLDYELPQYSPRVLSMTLDDDLNCIGERGDATRWISHNEIESFVPIDAASQQRLSTGWSLCTSMAFGYLVTGGGSCEETSREFWVEAPTGYCGDGACYDGEPREDSATCRLDPNATNDARPLCCSPRGGEADLPLCDAFHVRASYVAAAVEITDAPVNDGAPLLPEDF